MQRISKAITEIMNGIRANPEKLIKDYRKAYPGITDNEARELAAAFLGLFEPGADHKKAQREYGKKLDRIAKKYPGGVDEPCFDLPELNFDLPDIEL